MEGDAAYFDRRAQEERLAALKCAHPNARPSHLDMANRYAELASAIGSRDTAALSPVS